MNLSELPDIEFVNADAETVKASVFQLYSDIVGRSLAQGDPVRLFLLCISEAFIRLLNSMNYTGKQNLLKYAVGDNLDQLGALVNTTRLPASAATTTLQCTLSTVRGQETIIPAGTRVTTEDGISFAVDTDTVILAGQTTVDAAATCTDTGTQGNEYMPGEIKQIVDPVPYVASIVNTTKSEGGSDTESDDAFRERIYIAPERFSTAGPTGAYEYWAKTANASIIDVTVYSPTPGTVEVRPLLAGGVIPEQELLDAVSEVLTADTVRPLTDKVTVLAPEAVQYDIEAVYYLEQDAQASTVEQHVQDLINQYILWQKEKIGRDINPSQLISMVMGITGVKRVAVTKPVFTALTNIQVATAHTVTVTMGGSEEP